MGITVAKTAMFSIMVHRVDIIRLKDGPDHLYLQTNLPNPVWPFSGTLAIRLATTRGNGRQWIKENLNTQVEVTEADLETLSGGGVKTAPLDAPPAPLAGGEIVASVESRAAPDGNLGHPARKVLTLRRPR